MAGGATAVLIGMAVVATRPNARSNGYRAAIERDYWLLNIAVDPAFDPLRRRSEFSAIVRAIGLPD